MPTTGSISDRTRHHLPGSRRATIGDKQTHSSCQAERRLCLPLAALVRDYTCKHVIKGGCSKVFGSKCWGMDGAGNHVASMLTVAITRHLNPSALRPYCVGQTHCPTSSSTHPLMACMISTGPRSWGGGTAGHSGSNRRNGCCCNAKPCNSIFSACVWFDTVTTWHHQDSGAAGGSPQHPPNPVQAPFEAQHVYCWHQASAPRSCDTQTHAHSN